MILNILLFWKVIHKLSNNKGIDLDSRDIYFNNIADDSWYIYTYSESP